MDDTRVELGSILEAIDLCRAECDNDNLSVELIVRPSDEDKEKRFVSVGIKGGFSRDRFNFLIDDGKTFDTDFLDVLLAYFVDNDNFSITRVNRDGKTAFEYTDKGLITIDRDRENNDEILVQYEDTSVNDNINSIINRGADKLRNSKKKDEEPIKGDSTVTNQTIPLEVFTSNEVMANDAYNLMKARTVVTDIEASIKGDSKNANVSIDYVLEILNEYKLMGYSRVSSKGMTTLLNTKINEVNNLPENERANRLASIEWIQNQLKLKSHPQLTTLYKFVKNGAYERYINDEKFREYCEVFKELSVKKFFFANKQYKTRASDSKALRDEYMEALNDPSLDENVRNEYSRKVEILNVIISGLEKKVRNRIASTLNESLKNIKVSRVATPIEEITKEKRLSIENTNTYRHVDNLDPIREDFELANGAKIDRLFKENVEVVVKREGDKRTVSIALLNGVSRDRFDYEFTDGAKFDMEFLPEIYRMVLNNDKQESIQRDGGLELITTESGNELVIYGYDKSLMDMIKENSLENDILKDADRTIGENKENTLKMTLGPTPPIKKQGVEEIDLNELKHRIDVLESSEKYGFISEDARETLRRYREELTRRDTNVNAEVTNRENEESPTEHVLRTFDTWTDTDLEHSMMGEEGEHALEAANNDALRYFHLDNKCDALRNLIGDNEPNEMEAELLNTYKNEMDELLEKDPRLGVLALARQKLDNKEITEEEYNNISRKVRDRLSGNIKKPEPTVVEDFSKEELDAAPIQSQEEKEVANEEKVPEKIVEDEKDVVSGYSSTEGIVENNSPEPVNTAVTNETPIEVKNPLDNGHGDNLPNHDAAVSTFEEENKENDSDLVRDFGNIPFIDASQFFQMVDRIQVLRNMIEDNGLQDNKQCNDLLSQYRVVLQEMVNAHPEFQRALDDPKYLEQYRTLFNRLEADRKKLEETAKEETKRTASEPAKDDEKDKVPVVEPAKDDEKDKVPVVEPSKDDEKDKVPVVEPAKDDEKDKVPAVEDSEEEKKESPTDYVLRTFDTWTDTDLEYGMMGEEGEHALENAKDLEDEYKPKFNVRFNPPKFVPNLSKESGEEKTNDADLTAILDAISKGYVGLEPGQVQTNVTIGFNASTPLSRVAVTCNNNTLFEKLIPREKVIGEYMKPIIETFANSSNGIYTCVNSDNNPELENTDGFIFGVNNNSIHFENISKKDFESVNTIASGIITDKSRDDAVKMSL